MFNLELLKRFELEDFIGNDNKRFYQTPIGRLPSVTNILDGLKDKSGLVHWRKRIGNAKADEIILQSRNKGNEIHSLAQNYLLNNPEWSKDASTINIRTFNQIKRILDENVKTVYGAELPLWSASLKTAGRTDAVVKWEDYNAVLDFKTSRRIVDIKSEKLRMYKLQTVVYALMIEEQYKLNITHCSIIVVTNHEGAKIFTFSIEKYRDVARQIFEKH